MRNPFPLNRPMSLAQHIEEPSNAYVDIVDNLLIATDNRPNQRWLVTSARTGDGATATAIGLAHTLSARGKNTLLVDANFADKFLSNECCKTSHSGLLQALNGECEITTAILPSNETRPFCILPAGTGTQKPLLLLDNNRVKACIETLSTSFDYVLIDAPAFDSSFDARLWPPHAHGCILVVRAEKTGKPLLLTTKRQIEKAGGKLLGFVFNCERPWAHKIANYWL